MRSRLWQRQFKVGVDAVPAGYERMRDAFIAEGMSRDAAQGKAARIWNAKHPENPVGRGYDDKGRKGQRGRKGRGRK